MNLIFKKELAEIIKHRQELRIIYPEELLALLQIVMKI
jgi:hypothetical protein